MNQNSIKEKMLHRIRATGRSESTFTSKNPLESLLSNPQAVVEHRKSEEKPTLRVFAG